MVQNKTNVFKTCFSQNYSLASARMSRTIKKNRFYTSDMQVISITPFTGLHLQKDNVCKVITNSWLLSRVCTFKQTQTTNKHDRKVITLSLTHTQTSTKDLRLAVSWLKEALWDIIPVFVGLLFTTLLKQRLKKQLARVKKLCLPRVYYSSPQDCLKFNTAAANYLLTSQIRRWSPAAVASWGRLEAGLLLFLLSSLKPLWIARLRSFCVWLE